MLDEYLWRRGLLSALRGGEVFAAGVRQQTRLPPQPVSGRTPVLLTERFSAT